MGERVYRMKGVGVGAEAAIIYPTYTKVRFDKKNG